MKYEQVLKLNDVQFRRSTAVKRTTFNKMLEILEPAYQEKKLRGGRHSKKRQRSHYSGKKKRHTIKTQMVVNKANGTIICTNFANGRKHDFKVFKESKVRVNPKSKIVVDSGYQGLQKIHINTMLPKKKIWIAI